MSGILIPFGGGLISHAAPFGGIKYRKPKAKKSGAGAFLAGGCNNCYGGTNRLPGKVAKRNVGKTPHLGTYKRKNEIYPGCVCQNTYDGTRIPQCYCRKIMKQPNRGGPGKNPWIDFVHDQVRLYPAQFEGATAKAKYVSAISDPNVSAAYKQYKEAQGLAPGQPATYKIMAMPGIPVPIQGKGRRLAGIRYY